MPELPGVPGPAESPEPEASGPPAPADQDVPAAVAELSTEAQVLALLHPLRRRVLAALVEPASPAEVGRRLGIAPQVANYHVHALAAAGLAIEVETRRKRNLLEHRFRAIARSFTLSTALPLTEGQRRRLQGEVVLQQLVHAGDAIRRDALRLLESRPADSAGGERSEAAAALELDVVLADGVDRASFVRALSAAIREAAEPFRRAPGSRATPYRLHVAIYPVTGGTPSPPARERERGG